MWSDFALSWVGAGRTITLGDADQEWMAQVSFVPTIGLRPVAPGEPRPLGLAAPARDERVYHVSFPGAGYEVVVRRLGMGWYMRSVRLTVIV